MLLMIFKRIPFIAWLLVVGAMCVGVTVYKMKSLQMEVTRSVFERDSIEAFHAKTVLRIAGQRRLATRQAIQTELERDSLNKALNTLSRVKSQSTVVVEVVRGSAVTTLRPDTTFKFNLYESPYTLAADFKVQPDGTTAKLNWTVKQDSFKLGVRVDCSKNDNHGVRSAYLTLDVPKYMTATIDSVSQSREVCSGGARVANTGVGRIRAYIEAGTIAGGILVVAKVVHWLMVK